MNDDIYIEQRQEYIREIKRAVRAGLIWHPSVYNFVYAHKALGNKKILRKIEKGLGKGVNRPIKENDLKFHSYL